jgi:mono/diheme cytochrome c family protein
MRRPRTQDLTDGELFAIIKNGVRLTGMPAWGDPSGRDDADTWKLVHFIRHLPKITPAEVEQMKEMNPISPAEMKERQAEEEFLKGK